MEWYATDLTLSFGFCYYFLLWLFFNFLISCLALPCPPVCKPEAVGLGIAQREINDKNFFGLANRLSLSLSHYFFPLFEGNGGIKNYLT